MNPEHRFDEAQKQLEIAAEELSDERKAEIAGQLAGLVAITRDGLVDQA